MYDRLQIVSFPTSYGKNVFAYAFAGEYQENGWEVYNAKKELERLVRKREGEREGGGGEKRRTRGGVFSFSLENDIVVGRRKRDRGDNSFVSKLDVFFLANEFAFDMLTLLCMQLREDHNYYNLIVTLWQKLQKY
jgi:hypothetical protein